MSKDKLRRFAATKEMSNFFEPEIPKEFYMKGKWNSDYFRNDNPIVVELGCGKGEYSVGLAQKYPHKNFIGVDIKGARMYVGATEALTNGLRNVAFCRTKIDFINDVFGENEVNEIWLTFSDPQPKKTNKRLTAPVFIERYKQFLKSGGLIHLKTDSPLLFEYTQQQIQDYGYESIESTWDLYGEHIEQLDSFTKEILDIKTHYEKLFTSKGEVIKYCKFKIH